MNKKKFPDFPIHPGDKVYFPGGKSDIVSSVGVTEEGNLVVGCRHSEVIGINSHMIGPEDKAFLTEEDAEKYDKDPKAFDKSYGIIDWESLNLPVAPGQTYYFCDYDPIFQKWAIWEEYYNSVFYEADGGILVGDGWPEYKLEEDPCFDTPRKARAYVKKHWHPGDRWKG